jgi:hypothetical protein
MQRGEALIYSGRISSGDLLGIPDVLRKMDNGYIPGDIKSGAGEESGGEDEDEVKPKITYAVQLGLYVDILERLGFSTCPFRKFHPGPGSHRKVESSHH